MSAQIESSIEELSFWSKMKKLMKLIGLNEESFTNLPRIQVGICARDKKARAAQMEQILNRLKAYGE